MTRDIAVIRKRRAEDKKLKRKVHQDSDSESNTDETEEVDIEDTEDSDETWEDADDDSETEEDSFIDDEDEDEDNEGFKLDELRKTLYEMYPSKHLKNKIKQVEKEKSEKSKTNKSKSTVSKTDKSKISTRVMSKNLQKYLKNKKEKETESDEESSSSETENVVDARKSKKIASKSLKKKSKKNEEDEDEANSVNIIFTIGGDTEYYDDDDYNSEYDDEDFDEEDTENEDDPVSSDSDSDESDTDSDNELPCSIDPSQKKSASSPEENLAHMRELLAKNPRDKTIKKCVKMYEAQIEKTKRRLEKRNKKQQAKNMRIFRKILSDKNVMNDFICYKKLPVEEQKRLIKELREINKITRIEKPYRMSLLESSIPIQFKAAAMKKINSLRHMEPGSGEFYKIKGWVDTFMKIPFTNYQSLPVNISDGVDVCHDFMETAQKTLDTAVYGLNDAKMQIMQMLGQLLTNPSAIGTAIAIHGPPGTGKTSLVKEGISKILNRPFEFIALGGATDSSFLEGHGYTYEGSRWGKIVEILINSKCMNPVIYFDELDKISDTPRGEEITGILTHLTDTTQNSAFHDKYFAEINFDLSKCLFIFSYNDESKVNPILKDRMYRIKTKGYTGKEKIEIVNNYLLPKIREQVRFKEGEIIIPEEVINYINETHCDKEDGVRNMKRCLEIIHTKLNLYRLMKPDTNLFEGEMSLRVEFPFVVTKAVVDKLIKRENSQHDTWRALYN